MPDGGLTPGPAFLCRIEFIPVVVDVDAQQARFIEKRRLEGELSVVRNDIAPLPFPAAGS